MTFGLYKGILRGCTRLNDVSGIRKIPGLIALFLGFNGALLAQDLDFAQFYHHPLFNNPAAAGAEAVPRISIGYRNQWPGIIGTYSLFSTAADVYFKKWNSGVGVMVNNQNIGVGNISSTDFLGIYSFKARLNKHWDLHLGAQGGYVSRGASFSNYVFGDQLLINGDQNQNTLENLPTTIPMGYFDVGVGALLKDDHSEVGVSVYHLTMPNQTLMGKPFRLPMRFQLIAKHKIILQDRSNRTRTQITSISPAVFLRFQGPFRQMNLGFLWDHTPFQLGLFYRGIPFLSQDGINNNDGLHLMAGFLYKGLTFGYSYDITLSKLTNNTGGAHELHLGYYLHELKPVKPKRIQQKKK